MRDKLINKQATLCTKAGTNEASKNTQKFSIPDEVIDVYKKLGLTADEITYLNTAWSNAYATEDKKLRGLS